MSGSIEGVVGASLAIENAVLMQEKDNALLKKVLEGQEATILGLIDSAMTGPQELALSGMVGTKLHVTA